MNIHKFAFVHMHLYNIHLHIYIQSAIDELHDLIEELYVGLKFNSPVGIQVSFCVCIQIVHTS